VQACGVGDGEFRVAAGSEAEVGDDPLAEPAVGSVRSERVDHPGDLPAGDRRQLGGGRAGAAQALAQGGVEEVYPGCPDGDPDLAGTRHRVLDLLVREVLGGTEGVQSDGVHRAPPGLSRGARAPRHPPCDLKRA